MADGCKSSNSHTLVHTKGKAKMIEEEEEGEEKHLKCCFLEHLTPTPISREAFLPFPSHPLPLNSSDSNVFFPRTEKSSSVNAFIFWFKKILALHYKCRDRFVACPGIFFLYGLLEFPSENTCPSVDIEDIK